MRLASPICRAGPEGSEDDRPAFMRFSFAHEAIADACACSVTHDGDHCGSAQMPRVSHERIMAAWDGDGVHMCPHGRRVPGQGHGTTTTRVRVRRPGKSIPASADNLLGTAAQ